MSFQRVIPSKGVQLKVIYDFAPIVFVTGTIHTQSLESSALEVNEEMTIDEATYLILRSASGAFSCKYPPVPRNWNPVDRPHVAMLVPDIAGIFSVFLSNPEIGGSKSRQSLEVSDLNRLPAKTVIEIRHNNSQYAYYRRDNGSWTKVAEASDPFVVEVFSHGYAPIIMNMIPQI
jgi:hypothetical protein